MESNAQWLERESFTLMLSAGFFGFFSHTGLLRAFEERELVPANVVGVSAGALAGGLWCSGISATDLAQTLHGLRRDDFWDPGLPLGGLLKGRKFGGLLRELLSDAGVGTVDETSIDFTPVVHDVLRRKPVAVRSGPLDIAIRASCTVPLMFRPIVFEKQLWVDGGVSDRCGMTALRGDERVLLHYLPSRRRFGPPSSPPTRVPSGEASLLLTPDLPKVTPFRLDQGPVAYQRTLDHVRGWLDQPFVPLSPRA